MRKFNPHTVIIRGNVRSRNLQDRSTFMWRRRIMKWSHMLAFYLFWPAVCLVMWGELNPHPPDLEAHFWDKSLHFMAYFGLAGIGTVAFDARKTAIYAVLGLIAMGGALEIAQGFVGRDMSIFDELANSLGAVSGFFAGWLVLRALGQKTS
jgi:VanZ family protein